MRDASCVNIDGARAGANLARVLFVLCVVHENPQLFRIR